MRGPPHRPCCHHLRHLRRRFPHSLRHPPRQSHRHPAHRRAHRLCCHHRHQRTREALTFRHCRHACRRRVQAHDVHIHAACWSRWCDCQVLSLCRGSLLVCTCAYACTCNSLIVCTHERILLCDGGCTPHTLIYQTYTIPLPQFQISLALAPLDADTATTALATDTSRTARQLVTVEAEPTTGLTTGQITAQFDEVALHTLLGNLSLLLGVGEERITLSSPGAPVLKIKVRGCARWAAGLQLAHA